MDEYESETIENYTALEADIDRLEAIREELKERIGWTGGEDE